MVTRQELEKLARAGGWRNKDMTIERILSQSQRIKPSKDVSRHGQHTSGETAIQIPNINGLSDFLVFSTGTQRLPLDDGSEITFDVDREFLDELACSLKGTAARVLVGHAQTHNGTIGYLSNLRVSPNTSNDGSFGLYGTVMFPEGDNTGVDKTLQSKVIDGIKKSEIKEASVGFSYTISFLSDNNPYVTGAYIRELSIIPPVGYKLEDDMGKTSFNLMEPLSDAHIVAFAFGKGKIAFYENNDHQALVNVNGRVLKIGGIHNLVQALQCRDHEFLFDKEIEDEKDMEGYEMEEEYEVECINEDECEYLMLGIEEPLFVRLKGQQLSFSSVPSKTKYVQKLLNNLNEAEKRYLKL